MTYRKRLLAILLGIFSLAILGCGARTSEAPKPFYSEFLWTAQNIDSKEPMQFASMSENQIVETLRTKYGIKVIILSSAETPNPHLTIGNLREDRDLVSYFEQDAEDQICVKTGTCKEESEVAAGQFLYPYEHRHSSVDNLEAGTHRPGLNKPIIVLTKSSTRRHMIHEFMHYYLGTLTNDDVPQTIDGVLHCNRCSRIVETLQLNRLLSEKQKFHDENINTFSSQAHYNLDMELEKIRTQIIINNFTTLLKKGEEIDIHRFCFDHRKKLGFNTEEAAQDLGAIVGYVKEISKKMKDMNMETVAKNIQKNINLYSPDVQSTLSKLEDLFEKINSKITESKGWISSIGIPGSIWEEDLN
ncbi:MAG: hypothetical protein HYW47_01995 [Deltaproteobacteria bacterium]|nr:hypothetical protein [Deltaproteobacteria bacterium]